MKRNVLKKWLAMTLALTMTFSMTGFTVLAAEEPAEAAVVEETVEEEAAVPADEADAEAPVEEIAEEAAEEAAEEMQVEETAEEPVEETAEEAVEEETDVAEAEETTDAAVEAEDAAEAEESEEVIEEEVVIEETVEPVLDAAKTVIEATAVEIAGKTYYYVDLSDVADGAEISITINGEERTDITFEKIGDSSVYYYCEDPLSGSLYGTDDSHVTSYTEFYNSKGVSAAAADYDVISSATNFTGHHAGDIPAIIARNESGIIGIKDNVEVEADVYAEAMILKAAGKSLSEEQESAAAVTLNEDPSSNPEEADKTVSIASSSYNYSCKYGNGEFVINPDDTADGFVWTDYKNALYGAVISDGTNKAGAVWWTDLYGESTDNTASPHYNKVEIAVNNGTSVGSNQATVNRYAAMYNDEKPELKAGTYTVTLYARGYNTVSTQIDVLSSYDTEVTAALSADKASVELTGLDGLENPKATVTRTEGTGRQAKTFTYASDAEIVDGKVALDTSVNELVYATYTVTVKSDNYSPVITTFEYAFSGYVLMNVPYSVFYGTESSSVADVDAVSSATNKAGNYSLTGGAYHSGKTEEGGAAVGAANNAKMAGVIWPVKADSLEAVTALGGTEITDASMVTIAEAHHGQTSTADMVGYEALVESPAYSYYVLAEAPANYLILGSDGAFTSANSAQAMAEAETDVVYGGHWGDVQVNVSATDFSDKLVDAIVLKADDGTNIGLYHLDQIWRGGTQLAWKKAVIDNLDGKTITSITYYCMDKDADLTDGTAPAYANYVYEYPVSAAIKSIFTGEVTAAFDSETQITVTGLPEDAENAKATVYNVVSFRPAVYAYLTPVEVDSATDGFVPVEAAVADGKITFTAGSVTNAAGTEQTYGEPVLGKIYTVVVTSDNYGSITATADYTALETEIAGIKYVYTDLNALAAGTENVTANGTAYAVSDFTQIGETGIAYYSESPLTGTLYGTDPDQVTSYTDIYSGLGVDAASADYDVISSATNFTGYHVKDIPAIIARDESGITGVRMEDEEVAAEGYVEAFILSEAGKDLTQEQTAALAVILNADPTVNPADGAKAVSIKSASYGYTCKYGNGEFIINPDDTLEGFVWSDYKDALYAAVISDGTNKAGAVWWTDLYGETTDNVNSPHYNKVEIAVNNGTSTGSNQATVNRYAAMYNTEKPELKAGTYTVTLYAKGYETVSAEIEVLSSYDGEMTAVLSEDKAYAELSGIDELENPKATVTRTEGTGRQAKTFTYASNADVVDGKVALDTSVNELIPAVYTVTVTSDNYAPVKATFEYSQKSDQTITAVAAAEKVAIGKTVKITVTGAEGEVSYTSSDTGVATVSADGTVKGKAVGTVTITVTSAETDSFNEATAEVSIKVVPGASSHVELTNVASGIKVAWNKVAGAKYYKVYRGSKLLFTTSRTYGTDTGVKKNNGTKYTYKVVATTAKNDESCDSTIFRTGTGYRLIPVGITSLKNTAAGKMTVTYNKNAKSSGYVVRFGLKKDMTGAKVITIKGANTLKKVLGGLKKGKTYYVQVRTYKLVNGIRYYSGYCTTKSVKITK